MSTGGLPDDPREICLICADMVYDDSDVSDDVLALLDKCADIEERAVRCHELRGLLCPFSETADLCEDGSPSAIYRVGKRALDILGGLVGSAIVVLLLPLIAAIVKIQSPGSIFFSQERVGLNGKPFRLLKFRTMHEKTSDEARWASEEEDRIFGFGSFMRRFHIDEFPQFFNVLRGNMSLVGPRPEQVPIVERLREKIPHYDERHCALPGLTGWAQMRHGYAGCELTSWIKIASDLYYVKHRSLWLDVAILVRTVPAVLIKEQSNNGFAGDTSEAPSEDHPHDADSVAEQRLP
ncbi:MAG: sugar transferase [Armatimonadota bacterium]|jgi:lipopolysaccharide/colanic/teichoic acid biosynthesis glycosyltransferase